jgi:hypothetical protein
MKLSEIVLLAATFIGTIMLVVALAGLWGIIT